MHWTALLEAVILGDGGKKHKEIVQLLVDDCADLTIGDENGITPLEHAEERGFQEIVEILKSAQVNGCLESGTWQSELLYLEGGGLGSGST